MDTKDKEILIVRYLTGSASAKEQEELLGWLHENEDNLAEFISFKDAYELGRLPSLVKQAQTGRQWKKMKASMDNIAGKRKRTPARLRMLLGYAAVLLAGVLSVPIINMFTADRAGNGSLTFIETGIGERSRVVLPDSTVVWLNSCSSIGFNDFKGKKCREIDLRGEAYFEVRKARGVPLHVRTAEVTYKVTGTSFNVSSFEDDMTETLALVEGGVTLVYGDYSRLVQPGETVEFDKEQKTIAISRSDASRSGQWRGGVMTFDRISFADLARRLERNFAVSFVFESENMKKQLFGGTFDSRDNIETILKVISTSTPMKYRIEGRDIYIY